MFTLWFSYLTRTAVFFGLAGVLGHGAHKIRTFALHLVPLGGKLTSTISELVLDQHQDVILTLIMKDLTGKEHRQKAEETREVRRGETSHLVTTATVTLRHTALCSVTTSQRHILLGFVTTSY